MNVQKAAIKHQPLKSKRHINHHFQTPFHYRPPKRPPATTLVSLQYQPVDPQKQNELLQSILSNPTSQSVFWLQAPKPYHTSTSNPHMFADSQAEESNGFQEKESDGDTQSSSEYDNLNEIHHSETLDSDSGTHSEYADLNEIEEDDGDQSSSFLSSPDVDLDGRKFIDDEAEIPPRYRHRHHHTIDLEAESNEEEEEEEEEQDEENDSRMHILPHNDSPGPHLINLEEELNEEEDEDEGEEEAIEPMNDQKEDTESLLTESEPDYPLLPEDNQPQPKRVLHQASDSDESDG